MLVVGGRYQDTPPERLPWAKTEDGKVSVKVRHTHEHLMIKPPMHVIVQHRPGLYASSLLDTVFKCTSCFVKPIPKD